MFGCPPRWLTLAEIVEWFFVLQRDLHTNSEVSLSPKMPPNVSISRLLSSRSVANSVNVRESALQASQLPVTVLESVLTSMPTVYRDATFSLSLPIIGRNVRDSVTLSPNEARTCLCALKIIKPHLGRTRKESNYKGLR